MRIESSVTTVSWIPSEAVRGLPKLPFELQVAHYDAPPPDHIDDLEALRQADSFRFANELRAFIDVEDGRISGYGHLGGAHLGSTTVRFGPKAMVFPATPFPELRPPFAVSERSVTFVQTAGGRPGMPVPRRVRHAPFVRISAPSVWTTLALTIRTDGSSEFRLLGASPFPRHWIYDHDMNLTAKSATIDFGVWYRRAFGSHTPWGQEDSPAFVTVAETALERQLSRTIMRSGGRPEIRNVRPGDIVVEQGSAGTALYLLLDGVLAVEVDGDTVAEIGPGAVLGERAMLEGGRRTATLRAVSSARLAVAASEALDAQALAKVASAHRREVAR